MFADNNFGWIKVGKGSVLQLVGYGVLVNLDLFQVSWVEFGGGGRSSKLSSENLVVSIWKEYLPDLKSMPCC